MANSRVYISLDVGEKRIGVAKADDLVKIAYPLVTIDVDGSELIKIESILRDEGAKVLVVGYPRNQSGDLTAQTAFVEDFVKKINLADTLLVFQDESVTSVAAEERLKKQGKPYTKGDIDMQAATIILQDYLESVRA